MSDEKFVATQNNNNQDVMVKEIVVFDGRTIKNNRTILNNKYTFAGFKNNSCVNDCLDYLYYVYDMDKIKNIYVMGDGAQWIKKLRYDFKTNPTTNVMFCLDKFHFKQAIHHIGFNENIDKVLSYYVIYNDKENFIECCNELIKEFPYRKETIEEKRKYIINNWNYIKNLYKNKLKCPMESQISHTLADLLASRPKGYSLNMLEKILKLRLLYKNKHNLKLLYLNNYNKQEINTYKKEFISFRIFEPIEDYKFDEKLIPETYNNTKHDNTFSLDKLNLLLH